VSREKGRKSTLSLSREGIEAAAFEIIEREGLDGFSIRKLAAALGCEAMSIYHHFPSKAHLMDALLDRYIAGHDLPSADLHWRERLVQIVMVMRQHAMRQPAFFRFVALHRLNTAGGLKLLDYMLAIFFDAGLNAESAVRLFRATISYYAIGAALDETAGYAKGPSAVNPPSDAEIAAHYPRIVAAARYFRKEEWERTFDMGFRIMLEGIEREVERQQEIRCGSKREAKA